MTRPVGILGAGLIGRAWAIVFARAGIDVRLHDAADEALERARDAIATSLDDLRQAGLIEDTERAMSHIRYDSDLASAMAGVGYVQECGPEVPLHVPPRPRAG